MKGPSARRKTSRTSSNTPVLPVINIRPSAPVNVRKLQDSIDAVLVVPTRKYQLAWKEELDEYIKVFGIPKKYQEVSPCIAQYAPKLTGQVSILYVCVCVQKFVPFDEFHPAATRAATLSLIKQKVMKTYELKFDKFLEKDLPELTSGYDDLFVRISKRFVDEQIKTTFLDNNKALDQIPPHITGIKNLIQREFDQLYDGKIKDSLYSIKAKTIELSLSRIRDAQHANMWA